MPKGQSRTQYKRTRNKENRDLRPQAHAKYVRLADTKAKIVLDQIKGKPIAEARALLLFNPRYAASVALKVLDSAVANAEHNLGMDTDKLYVQEAYANRGSSHYSRWRLQPRARGRANRTEIKFSHVSIVLNDVSTKKKK
ncbi:MAG: 50S ribosomal protein L22 [Defluviitaleaceae bacterium]|nr:50S ribosomal protein L22 [Defluviitaleaceae bacterium]